MNTFLLEKLINTAFSSDLQQPFPVDRYYEELYKSIIQNSSTTSKRDYLQAICHQTVAYEKRLSAKVAAVATIKQLLESAVEPFLVGVQRLNSISCLLQQRVPWAATEDDEQKSASTSMELSIDKTALNLLSKVLVEQAKPLEKIIRNDLAHMFEESFSKKKKSIVLTDLMSKLAQYMLVLDLQSSSCHEDLTDKPSVLFDAFFRQPLMDSLQIFAKKRSAQLLLTCCKKKTIDWKAYLESLITLWSTTLKPELYVAFVQRLPQQPYKYCAPILPLKAKDEALLLSRRDAIQEQAQTVFYNVALPEKKISILIKYISEAFVQQLVNLQTRTKSHKSSKQSTVHNSFTLIRLYCHINFSQQSQLSRLFSEIDIRFSDLLRQQKTATRSSKRSQNQSATQKSTKMTAHLNTVRYLAFYERLLCKLLEDYLYHSPVCCELIRELLCRHLNDQQRKTENLCCPSFAKCLAGFMHFNLSSVHNSEPLECSWLDNSIHLIGYLTDSSRVVFEHQYAAFLGKRLLSPNSLYLSKERFVADQLAIEYGELMIVYAAHLEQMLRDVQVNSCEYVYQYSAGRNTPSKQLSLNVNILTPRIWEEIVLPKECLKDCLSRVSPYLPAEVLQALSSFKTFYSTERLKKKKVIQCFCIKHNWAVIELITDNNKGRSILVSAPQVMLLQWLTDAEKNFATYGQLRQTFKNILTQSELNRALKLLIHFSIIKLAYVANGRSVKRQQFEGFVCSDDDQLVFCDLQEVTIAADSVCNVTSLNVGSSLEVLNSTTRFASTRNNSKVSTRFTEAEVERHYQLTIDAAIVHVAKKNKQLLYQAMVDQVLAYLSLKKCLQGMDITANMIDRRLLKVLQLELVSAEPAQLDTKTRSNLIKYSLG